MSIENIKIVQNILKSDGEFDLAVKLDKAYYSFSIIEELDEWKTYILDIFVHPNYYLALKSLKREKFLINIFQGLLDSNIFIESLRFKINTNQ